MVHRVVTVPYFTITMSSIQSRRTDRSRSRTRRGVQVDQRKAMEFACDFVTRFYLPLRVISSQTDFPELVFVLDMAVKRFALNEISATQARKCFRLALLYENLELKLRLDQLDHQPSWKFEAILMVCWRGLQETRIR